MAINVLPRKWTVEDSLDLYSIRQWGNGYFSVKRLTDVGDDRLHNGF